MPNLPIDIVTTHPLTFRWRQVVDTAVGQRVVEHVGSLPMTCEDAVAALIGIVHQQALELGKIATQRVAPLVPPNVATTPAITAPTKRGK